MKVINLFCLYLLFTLSLSAQKYEDILYEAYTAYGQKDYATAIPFFEKAFALAPDRPLRTDYYQLAHSYAAEKDMDHAYKYMVICLDMGLKWLKKNGWRRDPTLKYLKRHPEHSTLIQHAKQNTVSFMAAINKEIQQDLFEMKEDDQRYREEIVLMMKKKDYDEEELAFKHQLQRKLDLRNEERLKGIISTHGWPSYSLVGYEAARYAWLVVQHADEGFQVYCLPYLREAVMKSDAMHSDLAHLEDIIRVKQGLPQLYGTQAKCPDGECELLPILDEEEVDKRRTLARMIPLSDYVKERFGIDY